MQRRVYVPGVAALLVALLAGCTGSSGTENGDDGKSGESGSSTAAAEPGRYRTLPEPCGAVDQSTLDSMLPGIEGIENAEQREKAYEGTATATYDTDRRVGCRWKVEAPDATHHLLVDFERVVSYDGTVSDEDRSQGIYRTKLRDAGIPEPSSSDESDETDGTDGPDESGEPEESGGSETPGDSKSPGSSGNSGSSDDADGSDDASGADSSRSRQAQRASAVSAKKGDGAAAAEGDEEPGSGSPEDDGTATPGEATPPGYEPRTLDDLGDQAFLDDVLTTAASATRQRTVTVVFRTSNVIVTVQYDEQPARRTEVPDSKEMQDNARELAESLADRFDD
ncbi:DUF3558 domain-containing protein [Streptomyces aurantiacus]|uniref:DUF3558 domain-containing protein n=1 Tax=Streptomyces aurantiacus JA 4570 TaxID=1286094 RepID=S4ATM1_9ACTN|nr:hypothetical protein [Streptomyces aurantiacus]EPH44772.1 hypothetical protein STRAU_2134 [Streptomyces aurantiacus JA 4570]